MELNADWLQVWPLLWSIREEKTPLLPLKDTEEGTLDKSIKPKGSVQDRGYAWVILLASFLIATLRGMRAASLGVYIVIFNNYFLINWTQTTAISAIQSVIGQTLAIPFSLFVRHFGCRISVMLGAFVVCVSFFITALTSSLVTVYLFFAVIGGIGFLGFQMPSNIPVQRYFKERRGLAISVVTTGTGVGLLIGSPVTLALDNYYGWQGSLMIQAGINLNAMVAGALLRPFVEADPQKIKDREKNSKISNFLRLPLKYYLFLFLFLLVQIGHSAVVLFTYMRAIKLDIDEQRSALLASILGVTALGRFIYGGISDLLCSSKTGFMGFLAVLAGCTILASTLGTSFETLLITQSLYGIFSAGYVALNLVVLVDFVGPHQLELANGGFVLLIGLSSLIANLVTGPMMDATGKPNSPFVIFGILQIIGGVGFILTDIYFRINSSKKRRDGEYERIIVPKQK